MKRQKDEKFSQVPFFLIGVVLIMIIIPSVLIVLNIYLKFLSEELVSKLTELVIGFSILGLIKIVANQIEKGLLQKMLKSNDFELMRESNNFESIDNQYFEGNRLGYYLKIFNHYEMNLTPFPIQTNNQLFVDVFCDTSGLSEEEIDKIEDGNYIVTHFSIRSVISNWTVRFNIKKISAILEGQIQLAQKRGLKPILKSQIGKENNGDEDKTDD